jgi:hypothetical protein
MRAPWFFDISSLIELRPERLARHYGRSLQPRLFHRFLLGHPCGVYLVPRLLFSPLNLLL